MTDDDISDAKYIGSDLKHECTCVKRTLKANECPLTLIIIMLAIRQCEAGPQKIRAGNYKGLKLIF